jgi:hypothetical protein
MFLVFMFLSPHDLISARQNGRTQKWREAVGFQSRDVRDCSDGTLKRELQRAGPETGVPMAGPGSANVSPAGGSILQHAASRRDASAPRGELEILTWFICFG